MFFGRRSWAYFESDIFSELLRLPLVPNLGVRLMLLLVLLQVRLEVFQVGLAVLEHPFWGLFLAVLVAETASELFFLD